MGKDVVVIGASAGGVKALQHLVESFAPDLQASIFIVLHSSQDAPCLLGQILDRAGPLPAACAEDREPIKPGRIYVALPGEHLVLEQDEIRLWRGPRENLHRPSINTLFRSAADAYGPRVMAAVLTGMLDDGTAGLWWVRQKGGTTLVQNPTDAEYPEMPLSAMRHLTVDHCVDLSEMGDLISRLARVAGPKRSHSRMGSACSLKNRFSSHARSARGLSGKFAWTRFGNIVALLDTPIRRSSCSPHMTRPRSARFGQRLPFWKRRKRWLAG